MRSTKRLGPFLRNAALTVAGAIAVVACTHDFDAFEGSVASGDASTDGGSREGSTTSDASDPCVNAPACKSTADKCETACDDSNTTCQDHCGGSQSCRKSCSNKLDSCKSDCSSTCRSCAGLLCLTAC